MATKQKIERVLTAMGRNFGKPEDWAGGSFGVWWQALKNERDEDIHRTTEAVMREKRRMPTVAAFREMLRGDPLTKPQEAPQGCSACGGSGWREVSWHRHEHGRLLVTSYAAGCDCPKGHKLCNGAARHWADVVRDYENDPRTEAVYHTSAQHPVLTMDERYHPDIVERIKGAERSEGGGGFQPVLT